MIDLLKSWNEVLAIFDFTKLLNDQDYPEEIFEFCKARIIAKAEKNWGEADRIRDELTTLGWKMIDEAGGKWRVEKM